MAQLTRREFMVATGAAAVAGLAGPSWTTLFESKRAKVAERVVAGGPNDFMVARHLRVEGSNREIGRALAEIAKNRHKTALGAIDPKVSLGRRSYFMGAYPELYERARGVSDVYGTDWASGDLDPTSLGYDLLDGPGCSTVYYPPSKTASGHAVLSRNFDFSTGTFAEMTGMPASRSSRPFTGDPYVVEMLPDKGHAALFLASYDLLTACIDGVNDKGLSVALLADDQARNATPTRGPRPGLGEIEITRFLLDRCATAKEAREALKDAQYYYSFIPCHYIVGDPSGDSFVWEFTVPGGERKVVDGGGKPQVVTNHLLSEFSNPDEHKEDFPAGSFNRYCKLRDGIAAHKEKLSIENIKALNVSVQAGPSEAVQGRPVGRTLWHSLYDLKERTLSISFYLGEDSSTGTGQKRSPYLDFKLS